MPEITVHLSRVRRLVRPGYGHRRLGAVTVRKSTDGSHTCPRGNTGETGPPPDGPGHVGNHLAHLSGFFTWVAHTPPDCCRTETRRRRPTTADPAPDREHCPRRRWDLKNTVDRIETFHHLTAAATRRTGAPTLHRHARPLRDRAIVFTILGSGPAPRRI